MNIPENIKQEIRENTSAFQEYLNVVESAQLNSHSCPPSLSDIIIIIIIFIIIILIIINII